MTKGRGVSKRLPQRNLHVPMPVEQGSGQFRAGAAVNSNRPTCRPDVSGVRVRLKKRDVSRAAWPHRV